MNSKNNGPVLLFKTIFGIETVSCRMFLRVANLVENGLKLEKLLGKLVSNLSVINKLTESVCKDVFERRASTGSGLLALFSCSVSLLVVLYVYLKIFLINTLFVFLELEHQKRTRHQRANLGRPHQ